MYAQLIDVRAAPGGTGELARAVRCELFVSLRSHPGFCGGLSLFDHDSDAGLLVLLWETGEQAVNPLPWNRASTATAATSAFEVDARL